MFRQTKPDQLLFSNFYPVYPDEFVDDRPDRTLVKVQHTG